MSELARTDNMELYYVKMSSKAFAPMRATPQAAGLDLKAAEKQVINPHKRELISTQLQMMIPEGYYGRIAPRSGLSLHHQLDICAGVIDSDYRGEIKILMHNHGDKPFEVNPGDRIAQLICERIAMPRAIEVKNLPNTMRGIGGFGSSGSR